MTVEAPELVNFYLVNSRRQRDGFLHRVLFADLVGTGQTVMRLLDVDHLVDVALDVFRAHIDLGQSDLSLVEGDARLIGNISHCSGVATRNGFRATFCSIFLMLLLGLLILS
jgi:hypothetical protein